MGIKITNAFLKKQILRALAWELGGIATHATKLHALTDSSSAGKNIFK